MTNLIETIKTNINSLNNENLDIGKKIKTNNEDLQTLTNKLKSLETDVNVCNKSKEYEEMFKRIGIPKLTFIVKDYTDFQIGKQYMLDNKICKHETNGQTDHSVSNFNNIKPENLHKYYIIYDEDTGDIFLYCEKCGIPSPKVLLTPSYDIDFYINNKKKIAKITVNPQNNKDNRTSCYKKLYQYQPHALDEAILDICRGAGNPTNEKVCNPIVLSVKFDYDESIKETDRDFTDLLNSKKNDKTTALNKQLLAIKELKVKSIIKLDIEAIKKIKYNPK